MIRAAMPIAQIKKFKRRVKNAAKATKRGDSKTVLYTAIDYVRRLISATPIARKTTKKIWNEDRTEVIELDIPIETPGRGFARSGWAAGAQRLRISTPFGRGPGSAKVEINDRKSRVEVTNAVPYIVQLDEGGRVEPIPPKPKPHIVKARHINAKANKRAKSTMERNLAKTAAAVERAWRR